MKTMERGSETRKVLLAFAKSIQERDILTYEHSRRVATYAHRLARSLGWSRRDARDLALAALVHDLGKTWIANDILNKSAALSDEERRKMERHPVIGARILIGCDVHSFYVETVLHHHEAWNGRGYPAGLQGEEIPMSARILAVADVYDVLTSQRPYKAPLSKDAARERLLQGAGSSFDPLIVQVFLHLLDVTPNFTLSQRLYAISPVAPRKTGQLPPPGSLTAGS
ncbi:MAG: HD-GYP domain-containing protein [Chloroflexota bacterium]|jgi:putative nucleotidyltransferase with HDIG domain|nr:HD-GYP domain-containing protein [Chloroflexota bacterium]HEV2654703.1 HD-GYP domain-containing protein [Ktedonobacteraceae bacterium]